MRHIGYVTDILASESLGDGHEHSERTARLSRRFAHRSDEGLPSVTSTESGEPSQQNASGTSDHASHHEAHLDLLEAGLTASLLLTNGVRSNRHFKEYSKESLMR
ncbi:hypothetical protein PFISCL1PPCAC_8235 [Pristionchus fissidentatus]|uniref:Uncharacterized protein n=1 Tax=Pristionchus fissidentatus TaxID=1538716 RepID=A0AAV5VCE3_9BILA|nr:hypothetical protein PFISCL1PPCAC_8235 [Pristionchus fissidentatus]